jgi:hypothetical protein
MKQDEVDPPKTDQVQPDEPSAVVQPTNERDPVARRKFLTSLAGAAGAAGAMAIGGQALQAQEVKKKILSRIQDEIERDHLEDPFSYDRGTVIHDKYNKGGGGGGSS